MKVEQSLDSIIKDVSTLKVNVVLILCVFSDDRSDIFQDEVPAEMVTIDRDLRLATLRPPAVKQRLLLVKPLVKVRDLPHLREGSQFYLIYTFILRLTNFVEDLDSFCLSETGVILVSA